LFAAGVNDTGGKFASGVVDAGGNLPPVSLTPAANLPPVSLTPVANLPPVSTTLVKLVAKMYIYVNSTIQRCPNKIIKNFLIEDLPPVSATPVVNLELRIFPRIFEKISKRP
jgi:hypothetical protein